MWQTLLNYTIKEINWIVILLVYLVFTRLSSVNIFCYVVASNTHILTLIMFIFGNIYKLQKLILAFIVKCSTLKMSTFIIMINLSSTLQDDCVICRAWGSVHTHTLLLIIPRLLSVHIITSCSTPKNSL